MSAAVLPALALVAGLYATVGHAGASGYIAVLTLAGIVCLKWEGVSIHDLKEEEEEADYDEEGEALSDDD